MSENSHHNNNLRSDSFTRTRHKDKAYTSILASRRTSHELDRYDYASHTTLSSCCKYRSEHNNSSNLSSIQKLPRTAQACLYLSAPAILSTRNPNSLRFDIQQKIKIKYVSKIILKKYIFIKPQLSTHSHIHILVFFFVICSVLQWTLALYHLLPIWG